ncbi:MAG: diguanylate cyclase [Mariprofundaceae bacterium]
MKEILKRFNHDTITLIHKEFSAAIKAHSRWLHELHCGLVAEEAMPKEFLISESHRFCPFGKWLYHGRNNLLEDIEAMQGIEKVHKLMHEEAYALATMYRNQTPIPVIKYNAFVQHLSSYSEQLSNFRDSLQEAGTMFDSLTGLFSRQAMMSLISNEHTLVLRGEQSCALAMLDLDHFKAVNDVHGHQAGDIVLHQTAQHILNSLRPYDMAFRYGGEEFLICLPNSDIDTSLQVMDRLRSEVDTLPIFLPDNETLHVTVSIGVAALSPDESLEQTISNADKALYTAKESGRNKVILSETKA